MLEVTARWQEDRPDGFAVTVSFESAALGEHFASQLLVAFEGLDHDARWSPEIALRHLRDVGRMPEPDRNETIRRRAVGIVAWLQERGYIAADEHNGVAWHQVGQAPEPSVEALPSPPPTDPTLEPAKKGKAARPRAASRKRARPAAVKNPAPAAKKRSKKAPKKA